MQSRKLAKIVSNLLPGIFAFVLNVRISSDANSFSANGTGIKYTSTLYSVSGRKSSSKKKLVSL